MKATIDCYGRPSNHAEFQMEAEAPLIYRVDDSDPNYVYLCYQNDAERAIHRITIGTSGVTREWAFGAWADRASLTYQEIGYPMSIDEEKISRIYRPRAS